MITIIRGLSSYLASWRPVAVGLGRAFLLLLFVGLVMAKCPLCSVEPETQATLVQVQP